MWDAATGEEIRQFVGHTMGAERLLFSHDGHKALSASWDTTAILWDIATGNIIHHFVDHIGAVTEAEFSPDDRLALTGSQDDTAMLWDLSSGQAIRRYRGMDVYSAVFSPDGRDVFVNSMRGNLALWHIDSTADELLAWTQANRYIPELTCEQRELYRLEPLCPSTQE